MTNKNADAWFVAKEVCEVLGLGNITEALRYLDDDEKGNFRNPEVTSKGGNPFLKIINEPGLYSLVLRSRKEFQTVGDSRGLT